MSDAKWNSFPHLTAAELADDDQIPVSDSSQPEGEKDATTTIGAVREAIGGGGVPAGGSTGQVLKKASGADFDTEWANESGGGGNPAWGDLTGTLADQTDLNAALNARLTKHATVNAYAGNRTLDTDDSGAYVRITDAGTVTLPDGLDTGFQCVIVNATNSDTVELTAATTLTLPSGFEPEIQNRRAVTVIHVGSNVWEAHGALVEES